MQNAHRFLGSFLRQLSTISFIAFEYLYLPPSRSTSGGASRIVLLRTLAGGKSEFGAWPSESSRAVMPSDQMSAGQAGQCVPHRAQGQGAPFESYSRRSTISGAIQQGVPTNDLRLANPRVATVSSSCGFDASAKSEDETPKSARRTVPSSTVMGGEFSARTMSQGGHTIDEEVRGLDVAVQPTVLVEIGEALERLLEHRRDDDLVKAVLVCVFRNVGEGSWATHAVSSRTLSDGRGDDVPGDMYRHAMKSLLPSIHSPRTRRTFGCLESAMS